MATPPAVLSAIINNYDAGTDNGLPSFPVQVPRTAPEVLVSVCECKRYAISAIIDIPRQKKKKDLCVYFGSADKKKKKSYSDNVSIIIFFVFHSSPFHVGKGPAAWETWSVLVLWQPVSLKS